LVKIIMEQRIGELNKLLKFICCSMHSSFSATFDVVRKQLGFFGAWEITLQVIEKMKYNCLGLVDGNNLDEKLKNLEKTSLFNEIKLERLSENRLVFKVDRCDLAGGEEGIHLKILKNKMEVPCPLVIAVAAYLKKSYPDKLLYVYPTVFTEWSSSTEIEILTPEKYNEKKENLRELARFEVEKILSRKTG